MSPRLGAVVFAFALCACDEPQPWDAPSWRPASPPQRIVAGSVLAAEVLLALEPGERLVAVHELALLPEFSLVAAAARGLSSVGANPEQLLAARPDLVIADAYTRAETLAMLAAAHVPIVRTTDPQSFADIAANVRRIGAVTWLDAGAERTVRAMNERLAAIAVRGRELPIWRLLGLDGSLHTYGAGSLFDAVLTTAGARNSAAEHGVGAFRKLDIEHVLAWRPDALLLSLPPGAPPEPPEWLLQIPGMALLPCVQRRRFVFVPAALLTSTSHRLVDACEVVQRQLAAWGPP